MRLRHKRLVRLLVLLIALLLSLYGAITVLGVSFAPPVALPPSLERAVALAVLTEISTATTHGYDDEAKPHHELAAQMARGEGLTLTCGYVSSFSRTLLAQVGIVSRRVMFLTKAEFDGNNGHTALEVNIGGVWYFADPDFGRFYEQPAWTLRQGRGAWVQIGEQYTDPEDAAIFPRHLDGGVTGIEQGDVVYFDCEDMSPELVSHVEDYAPGYYQCLSDAEFMTRFYS